MRRYQSKSLPQASVAKAVKAALTKTADTKAVEKKAAKEASARTAANKAQPNIRILCVACSQFQKMDLVFSEKQCATTVTMCRVGCLVTPDPRWTKTDARPILNFLRIETNTT